MKIINDLKPKMNTLIKNKKLFAVIGIVGMALVLFSTFFSGESGNEKSEIQKEDTDEYVTLLEEKIEKTVKNIAGAGDTHVMITLECGKEYIYAMQEKTTEDTSQSSKNDEFTEGNKQSGEEKYIIINTDNGEQALLVTEIAPKVKGVVVVCRGGGNSEIVRSVKNAVTTALNISESKVCVTAMK